VITSSVELGAVGCREWLIEVRIAGINATHVSHGDAAILLTSDRQSLEVFSERVSELPLVFLLGLDKSGLGKTIVSTACNWLVLISTVRVKLLGEDLVGEEVALPGVVIFHGIRPVWHVKELGLPRGNKAFRQARFGSH
jgi:hypothetical protein